MNREQGRYPCLQRSSSLSSPSSLSSFSSSLSTSPKYLQRTGSSSSLTNTVWLSKKMKEAVQTELELEEDRRRSNSPLSMHTGSRRSNPKSFGRYHSFDCCSEQGPTPRQRQGSPVGARRGEPPHYDRNRYSRSISAQEIRELTPLQVYTSARQGMGMKRDDDDMAMAGILRELENTGFFKQVSKQNCYL